VLEFSDNWVIPFELVSDLRWLGSGAQGAVFLGRLNDEPVAVKKVRSASETDIVHLRKLSHPNIIKFKLVHFLHFFGLFFFVVAMLLGYLEAKVVNCLLMTTDSGDICLPICL